jgi:hypothetical protein
VINWPSIDTAAYARKTSGKGDLEWALTIAYKGTRAVTSRTTRTIVGRTPEFRYADVPAGTEVVLEGFSNAGFNGIQVSARTLDGRFVVTYWDSIDENTLTRR